MDHVPCSTEAQSSPDEEISQKANNVPKAAEENDAVPERRRAERSELKPHKAPRPSSANTPDFASQEKVHRSGGGKGSEHKNTGREDSGGESLGSSASAQHMDNKGTEDLDASHQKTPVSPGKGKPKKKKATAGVTEVRPETPLEVPKKDLTPEERRAKAKAKAERYFQQNEQGTGWNRERSIAWLWLLAFPLVYIIIGWLFCILMNNSNPGAYPQRFSF